MDTYSMFHNYLEDSQNIYDIMAAAYKMNEPYESSDLLGHDFYLQNIISIYSETEDKEKAWYNLKIDLRDWNNNQRNTVQEQLKAKFFYLIRLIDHKCAKKEFPLSSSFYEYTTLNTLLADEIIILPRFDSIPIQQLSNAIIEEDENESGFRRRNQSCTGYVFGQLTNYIILKNYCNVKPIMHVTDFADEMLGDLQKKKFQLKIAIFPSSNRNIRRLFHVKETKLRNDRGLFSIKSPKGDYEDLMFQYCKEALLHCKVEGVDIAVFPEMLFTNKIYEEICKFVREYYESETNIWKEGEFPWLTWLGTTWFDGKNTCRVIDRYGRSVFEQNKIIPYIYKDEGRIYHEELSVKDVTKRVHFIDVPNLFRIATAICRDVSDDYLKTLFKAVYSDLLIVPAFSNSDEMTSRNIAPLVQECIIAIVCNACSSICTKHQEKLDMKKEDMGRNLPFCYLCLPGKEKGEGNDNGNTLDFHKVQYNIKCVACNYNCPGHFFTISFLESVDMGDYFAARITYAK
ncbi:MAG: hypothetical protein HFG37_05705 [Eubacterium sp.]|nr:hypothetical protein [Eubacterium sp.]